MTEPKVVHEWEDGETEYKLLLDGSLRWEQVDIGSRCILEGSLTPSSITKELARLAARVLELEGQIITAINGLEQYKEMVLERDAENARLREALRDALSMLRDDEIDLGDMEQRMLDALKEKP